MKKYLFEIFEEHNCVYKELIETDNDEALVKHINDNFIEIAEVDEDDINEYESNECEDTGDFRLANEETWEPYFFGNTNYTTSVTDITEYEENITRL